MFYVSIHAPRVGRDVSFWLDKHGHSVSIHAPRVGRDPLHRAIFQSPRCFNPRAPRGARPGDRLGCDQYLPFQSTRPAWGATAATLALLGVTMFQSTRPAWGATWKCSPKPAMSVVSIHAPRVGRDQAGLFGFKFFCCFNPRAPRGARHRWPGAPVNDCKFQSTRPAWGATLVLRGAMCLRLCFNPRAPRGARR